MAPILGSVATLIATATATSAVTYRRFVGFDDAQAGANGNVKGIADMDAAIGEPFPVILSGTIDMPSGGAIAAGDEVSANAAGLPVSGGTAPAGKATTTVTGPGQTVTILIR